MKAEAISSRKETIGKGTRGEWRGLFKVTGTESATGFLGHFLIVIAWEGSEITYTGVFTDQYSLAVLVRQEAENPEPGDLFHEDPQAWCGFPNTSGVFDEALADSCEYPCFEN